MDGIAPPSTSWKPVVILLYDIRVGRLGSCVPTRGGHFYSLELLLCMRPTWFVVLLFPAAGTTPVSSP